MLQILLVDQIYCFHCGKFSFNAAYKMSNQPRIQVANCPSKRIWKTKIPYKVAYFSWLLAMEVVVTQENLIKKKWILWSRCFLCEKDVKTVGHLFLHYSITDQLWKIFINLRGIAWILPRKISKALLVGQQLELEQLTETDGGWFLLAYGGQQGEKGILDVENSSNQIKLNCILLFCFWCNHVTEQILYLSQIR